MDDVLGQTGLVLLVCVGLGALAVSLRLPLLVGLLIAGLVVGPEVLGLVEGTTAIELLGEIGISLLLFVVGLKLDPRLVRKLGPVVLLAGLIQVVLTAVVTYGVALGFGLETVPALYLAAALSFSSTVVVIKLLTDRGQIEQLQGRLALGILIVQDIVVVALMVVLASFDPNSAAGLLEQFSLIALRGAALFVSVALLARYILTRVVRLLARRGELLVLAAVAWAVALAAIAHLLGFSEEVGAFLAGIALASSPYREAISGRLTTIRDFLLVFFFIDLGTQLRFEGAEDVGVIVALSGFALIGKPILIAVIATVLGFQRGVAVRAGLTLAQISEFSLILVALGVSLGQIDGRVAGVVAAIALITITLSTFLSAQADRLTPALSRPLLRLQRSRPREQPESRALSQPEIIVIGLGRLGRTLFTEFRERGKDVLGVDFDPRTVEGENGHLPVVFGDLEDPELPDHLPLGRTRWIVSTPRDVEAHRSLLNALGRQGYAGRVAVTANDPEDERMLRRLGADVVLLPMQLASDPLIDLIHAYDRAPSVGERTLE
jgi:Kef-type K+ transport system membrane component KefB